MAIRECIPRLMALGISYADAKGLRAISMTLHSWHEQECGNGYGVIERDEKTGKPFWRSAVHPDRRPTPIADREKGAEKRLAVIMARYPTFCRLTSKATRAGLHSTF